MTVAENRSRPSPPLCALSPSAVFFVSRSSASPQVWSSFHIDGAITKEEVEKEARPVRHTTSPTQAHTRNTAFAFLSGMGLNVPKCRRASSLRASRTTRTARSVSKSLRRTSAVHAGWPLHRPARAVVRCERMFACVALRETARSLATAA